MAVFELDGVVAYGESLLSNSLAGDPTSIVILAIIAIILIALVFEVSSVLFGIVKRFFLLIIIALSSFFFLTNYGERLASEGGTGQLIVIGVIGLSFAAAAIAIALGAFGQHIKERNREHPAEKEPSAPAFTPTRLQQPEAYTTQALTPQSLFNSLKDDRSLLAVLSYVIIAQFGVFSSNTISAPNPETGMIFFAIFFVGALIFVKTTYHSYLKGISHLAAASIFGIIISVVLGHFWAEFPLEVLLSAGYFATDAMVAFITGIAVSLLMGTKN